MLIADKTYRWALSGLKGVLGVGIPLLVAGIFFFGCAVTQLPPPEKDSGIRWEGKTAAEVFADLDRAQQQIRNFTAAFAISMTPPPKGRPSSLQGVLFFQKTPAGPMVRIQGTGPFGRTVFDMVRRSDQIEIYIPAKKTLYRGPVPTHTGDPWGNLFAGMFTDFSKTVLKSDSPLRIDADTVRLNLVNGFLILDKHTGLLKSHHQKDQIVTYDAFVHQDALPSIPGHIHLEKTDDSLRVECRLDQIQVNTDLGNAFDLSRYIPNSVRNISELNRN
ncbi:MAG: hypothetical protein RBT11_05265 [Desulfobacterales bacterium]|jgi:hypothetical protein|nr:hypothetical protein [Desulfobacterales bacterium]